jgi:hypothetical protein
MRVRLLLLVLCVLPAAAKSELAAVRWDLRASPVPPITANLAIEEA